MEIKFEVLLSSSIKRKKPWPSFCWLGKEKESVFLLDDNRISEINLASGQTKKKIPKLHPMLPRVLTMSGSQNGMWLAGILVSGEVFMWHRDRDSLKMVTPVAAVYELVSAAPRCISVLVSGDGQKVLVATRTGQVLLWECVAMQDLKSIRDVTVKGRWSQIASSEDARLPSAEDKEATLHSVFVKSQALGEVCLTAFVFASGEQLVVTFLKIRRGSSSEGCSVQWAARSYPLSQLVPPCRAVKSRGALIAAFSPDGQLLAVVLNQKDPRATQVLFISVQNFVTISSVLGGCGSKNFAIPSRYIRSYWVGSVGWTPEGLYLACVLKRGSLLMLARLGDLVSVSTGGCDIEFGPAHFLPLHPLVTYRPPASSRPPDDVLSSSGASLRDQMRQCYSVTWHPRLPCLIVSDGYMATVLKMARRPSSSSLMSCLLLDTAQKLERVRQLLGSERPQVKSRLESMSTLRFTASLSALKERETPDSTLPLVFRDGGETGGSRLTMEKAQVEDDDRDSDGGQCAGSLMEDGGRLEFASMFDTLHAPWRTLVELGEPGRDSSALLQELGGVRRSLLTAWALGVSLGGAMDQRERLLTYAVSCSVRLARLLCLADSVVSREKGSQVSDCFELLRSLLSFLPWDSSREGGTGCFGVVVDLARRFVQLFVPSSSGAVRSSRNFAAALVVLREVSGSLKRAYTLHQGQNDGPACPSDVFFVPLLQDDERAEAESSNRLVAVWRDLYTQALRYQEVLRGSQQGGELENMKDVVSQIQAVLQRAGDQLGESPALHSITGEQHFILGEYSECIQAWRVQLWGERERAGPRACFLETRYCLALLFGLLFQYRLKEAQAMCDRMARQLQSKGSQDVEDDLEPRASSSVDEARFDFWLPHRVNGEAAHAVVQSLGRFMASYFANRPLAIFPPHNVDLLPPLHMEQLAGRRTVALSQTQVAGAVRMQHLSGAWTVDYALELLLLGGLMPEAVWLAQSLGDWKMAASLGLAYATYCRLHYDFGRLKFRELHLPAELQPGSIFQAQLDSLLGCTGTDGQDHSECLPDLVEVEDMELLQVSVQEILRASVMAEVDVVSPSLTRLLESAKERASSLPALVPPAFYLPAPPLYCPQPAPNTQDSGGDLAMTLERESRCHVAAALQRSLLLFRAAHCSRPAAQWYVTGLRRCRRLLSKVRKNVGPENEGLKRFANRRGFFRPRPSGNPSVSAVAKQTMVCFRELCGLCWMLHVRDELTVSCRRYQAARNNVKDSEATDLVDLCVEVLRWACRLLPFSRFLNAEETLQDLVLSLVAELPPVPMAAETLVAVFSFEEDSVRVPLRDKYGLLLRRLNPCTVQASVSTKGMQPNSPGEEESGQTMMLLIQERRRRRAREERRLARRLAPVERYIWERDGEDDRGGADATLNRFSLGTSSSPSTLTNSDCTPLDSEDGTADTIHSPEPQVSSAKLKAEEKDRSEQREQETPSTPVVGTWTFELDDEEYLRFLELFLSYILEKDSVDVDNSELPLLSSFSSRLHDRELHSDTFDVMTTLKRHQAGRKRGERLPAFRAGSCFRVLPEPPEPLPTIGPAPSVLSDACTVQTDVGARPFRGRQPGLFGFRRRQESRYRGNAIASEASPVPKPLQERFKIVSCPDLELQLEPDSKLEAQFPQLARLLEWMLRWADRSILLTLSTRKNMESAAKPAVIRVRSSAPAVLCALRLMELRYSAALFGAEGDHAPIRLSERELRLAPVGQTETDWKRERDSSMDTGYPGSAGTPMTLPDLDHYHRPSSEVCEDPNEEQRVSHLCEQEDRTSDVDIKVEERRRTDEPSLLAESDVTKCSDHSFEEPVTGDTSEVLSLGGSSFIPSTSVQIQTRTCRPRGQALTLEDLKSSKTSSDDSSESCSEEIGTLHKTPLKEAASSVPEAPEPASLQQPERPSMSEPPGGFETTSQTQSCTVPQNGEYNPDPVRRLLQDELFRLVQLQQINFMSLMQVVGASFANPLLSQLSVPPSQTVQPQTQGTVVLPSHEIPQDAENAGRPNAVSELQSKKNRTNQQTSCMGSEHDDRSGPINPGLDNQELQHLTVRSDWPQDSRADSSSDRRFIPHSQGLLTTVKNQATLQAPSHGRPQIHPTPLERHAPTQVLRLIRLPPPAPVSEAWPPNRPDFNQYKPAVPRRSEDYTRARLPHVNLNGCTSQEQLRIPEASSEARSGGEEPVRLPPATNGAVPTPGPRLLHVSPDTRPIQLLRFPFYSAERQIIANTAGVPGFPKSQQLHVDPGPSRIGLQYDELAAHTPRLIPPEKLRAWQVGQSDLDNIPRPQLLRIEPEPPRADLRYNQAQPRLIPLEELMAWARTKQEVKLQLLKADVIRPSKRTTSPSKKRLKRREDKKKEGGDKKERKVSFRPNDSVIPPSQLKDEEPTEDDGYAIPLGSFESTLTGQRLLAEAYATSAELHAFAATQKHPSEVHDACTNTDPASPHSTTDEAAQFPVPPDSAATCDRQTDGVPGVPAQMYLKRHTPDTLVPERPASSGHAAPTARMNDTFVTVSDLEDGTQLQNQLFSQTPSQDTSCPPLTTAQLHLLAASVINPAQSNAEVQTEEQSDESPEAAPPELVYSKPEQKGDPVTLKVLTEVRASEGTRRVVDQTPFTLSQASADLVDMDARLAVLKNIADHMDTEFADMRLLVNTIHTPVPLVLASGEDELRSSSHRDVQQGQGYKRHVVELEDVEEEEEPTDRRFTSTPRAVINPAHRERWNVTSSARVQTSTTANLTGSLLEDSIMLPESTLGLTGLSDVADILRDLVKEGALSPSAFRLSTAVSCTKPDEEQGQVGTEEEKKDLRAWMKRKQQERLVDYRKQREEKRERERQPFTCRFSLKPTSRDLQLYHKKKEEKDKETLQKHHSQRVHEACSLMTEMLTTPLGLPAASSNTTKAQHQDSRPGSRARATRKNRSPKSQRGRSHSVSSLGRTVVLQRRGTSAPPGTLGSRLGLHRPASALPGDRLSQVTRRGMLTDPRGRTRAPVHRPRSGLIKCIAEPKTLKQREDKEERDVVSPWDVPLEVRQILGLESNIEGQGLTGQDEDILSESTGSILSKLDWAAIERIVAEEGDF